MRVLKKAGNHETQGPDSLLSSQNLLEPGQRWGSCPSSTLPTAQPPHTPSSASLQPASTTSRPRPSLASVPDPEASLSLLSHSQPSLSSLLSYTGSSRELCQQPHAPRGRVPTPLGLPLLPPLRPQGWGQGGGMKGLAVHRSARRPGLKLLKDLISASALGPARPGQALGPEEMSSDG